MNTDRDFKDVRTATPVLAESQLKFRIGLARQRTQSYPLDSMDFIMMDLERPDGRRRFADFCTGDLTGRLLESLSCSDGIDGKSDPRLSVLFERILKNRLPSGLFGRPGFVMPNPGDNECFAVCARYFPGFIRYHALTGDSRALDAAIGLADLTLRNRDAWYNKLKQSGGRAIEFWITEPLALLYGVTGNKEYLDFVGMINDGLAMPDKGAHTHGYLATLRGLQLAALITGDAAWGEKPEAARRMIVENHYETPDGGVAECFPPNKRNEGCAIADWLMLNLNAGLLGDDDAAYDKAERIFWNALAFNQWMNGGFGLRSVTQKGYGVQEFEEAWCCCVHHAGMAMTEYARHAVTFRNQTVRINLLVPGSYRLTLDHGRTIEVRIETRYPSAATATISATGIPADVQVRVRIPGCVKDAVLSESREGESLQVSMTGRLGHTLEDCQPGVVLKYGPLVLTRSSHYNGPTMDQPEDLANVMIGGGAVSLPKGTEVLLLKDRVGQDGFLHLSDKPRPTWTYDDEIPGGPCWIEGAPVNVAVKFANGEIHELRFAPMCSNLSFYTLHETTVRYDLGSHNKDKETIPR